MSIAVVTGASRGIGRGLVARLTEAGGTVVAMARSGADLEVVASETGALPYVVDVADPAAVTSVFERVLDEVGVPDLLVNNAAVSGGSALTLDMTESDWWRVMEVNVRGTVACCRAVVPAMTARGSGRIVNVSSGAATYPIGPDNDGQLTSAYMASKAAVNRFTEALAGEVRAVGVSVFAISPGTVKTDMTAEVFADDWDSEELWTPMNASLDLIADLGSGMLDALTGRYFRAASDDWRGLAAHAGEVLERDTMVQRLITHD
ncbi:MAG: short-chain dehydrogenase/reductase [Frankiales bacterium]|nr:short-chain dehydrogenase/reductase [Frankiales bacterium]